MRAYILIEFLKVILERGGLTVDEYEELVATCGRNQPVDKFEETMMLIVDRNAARKFK